MLCAIVMEHGGLWIANLHTDTDFLKSDTNTNTNTSTSRSTGTSTLTLALALALPAVRIGLVDNNSELRAESCICIYIIIFLSISLSYIIYHGRRCKLPATGLGVVGTLLVMLYVLCEYISTCMLKCTMCNMDMAAWKCAHHAHSAA